MNQFRETLFEHFNLVHIKITVRITKKMVGKIREILTFWSGFFFNFLCVQLKMEILPRKYDAASDQMSLK